ncbi:MAG TPA: hypothetical protein VFM76_06395 [Methylophaga sp.]|nr:hypothetical protein [Methylophaga sp.]
MKLLTLLFAVLLLSACYEDTDVTFHEAGIYKGSEDKHAISAEERADVLEQRFKRVQTDR